MLAMFTAVAAEDAGMFAVTWLVSNCEQPPFVTSTLKRVVVVRLLNT